MAHPIDPAFIITQLEDVRAFAHRQRGMTTNIDPIRIFVVRRMVEVQATMTGPQDAPTGEAATTELLVLQALIVSLRGRGGAPQHIQFYLDQRIADLTSIKDGVPI